MQILRQIRKRYRILVVGADVFLDLPDAAVIFTAGIDLCPGRVDPEVLRQDVQELEQPPCYGKSVISRIIQIFARH